MGLIGYLRQKHFGLRFLMVSCIVCSALTGTGVYLRQKAIRRNLQGITYMSHSLLLLKMLNETSADGKVSDDNVEILESMAYSSALFGMLQGKKFRNEPWIDFLNEMQEYLLLHPRRKDTPVIIELKKMLNNVFSGKKAFK